MTSPLHSVARLAEERIVSGPMSRADAKAVFEALAETSPAELAFATASLLAVAAAHPAQAHRLVKIAAARQPELSRRLDDARKTREDEGRAKLDRFRRFLGG